MSQVRDYLIAHRILAFRMQSGAHVAIHNGRERLIRYGTPGMADWICFPRIVIEHHAKGDPLGRGPSKQYDYTTRVFWVECKAPKNGRQSPGQKAFQKIVEDNGHSYAVVRSIEDLEAALRKIGAIR